MILPDSIVIVLSPAGHKVKKCSVECDGCKRVTVISLQLALSKTTHRCIACSNRTKLNKHRIGVAPVNKQIRCIVNCLHCGKEKSKTRRGLEIAPLTFCNTSCQVRWQNSSTDFNKGTNNPSYRHGERVDGRVPNYGDGFTKELRRRVKIRDGFNCQECHVNFSGKLSKHLDVHHVDEDKTNNADSNLVSLCKPCHTRLHWVQLNKKRAC